MSTDGEPLPQLLELYPWVGALPPATRERLVGSLQWIDVGPGAAVFDEHQVCAGFPFVLAGSVRVSRVSGSGREFTLYRVEPGGACVVTASCLLAGQRLVAQGRTEGPTRIGLMPAARFAEFVADEHFRKYVFGLLSERIVALMQLVEDVGFRRFDQRLARLLLDRGPQLATTHQALADELGSVREIVSRTLGDFTQRALVEVDRGRITVRDCAALERLAAGGA